MRGAASEWPETISLALGWKAGREGARIRSPNTHRLVSLSSCIVKELVKSEGRRMRVAFIPPLPLVSDQRYTSE